jgi:hypothetical protein
MSDVRRREFIALLGGAAEQVPGDMAEIGVYQGNPARILAEAARASGRQLYLFDTFEGCHAGDLRGPDHAGVPGHFELCRFWSSYLGL